MTAITTYMRALHLCLIALLSTALALLQGKVAKANIPAAAPVVRVWYVEREAIVADVCTKLGVRIVGDGPTMVGLAGPGGAGKSTVASMVVARDDVREHFHKAVLWLPVGQGAKHRVYALMRQLATMVYEKVLKKNCRPLDKPSTAKKGRPTYGK